MGENGKSSAVQALSRGLGILCQFTAKTRSLSLTDLSNRTGLHRATVYRFAKTLENEGFLTYDAETSLYTIGPAWAAALYTLGSESVFFDILRSDLTALAESMHEAVSLGVRRGSCVQILSVMPTSRVFLPKLPHSNLPGLWESWNVHAQIHLAYADEDTKRQILREPTKRYTENTVVDPAEIRARLDLVANTGVAFDREEHAQGVCAMAVPVFSHARVMAALGCVVPIERFGDEDVERNAEQLRAAARAMGARMETAEGDWGSLR